LIALALALLPFGSNTIRAQEPGWERTGLGEATRQLFTPAGGAFFALTAERLLRSDDAGATWQALSPPAQPGQRGLRAAVSDADQSLIYAGGANGLFRSADAGATWTPLAYPPPAQATTAEAVETVAVSPADPRVVYLGLTGTESISAHFRFLRSRDGGTTWDQLEVHDNSLCGWGVRVLQPHPTDAQRVFRVADCYAGRNLRDTLWQSLDQGTTWTPSYEPPSAFPTALAGGAGAQPQRYYAVASRDARAGGGVLLARSDDDGRTWREVASWAAPDSPQPSGGVSARAGGLAYDPARPDRVYVGLNETPPRPDAVPGSSRVSFSADGGATWVPLGSPSLPTITTLALGIDARNLYAATDQGVWRLPLDRTPSKALSIAPVPSCYAIMV
jgi:photosystem II stability/assembly factor-like uncharacterized protein